MNKESERKIRLSIDRGGTFTDIYAQVPNKKGYITHKLLSVNPTQYKDAPTEGIRRILDMVNETKSDRNKKIPCDQIASIRMGTTVATNALLERNGVETVFIVTKGFKDILKIGNQTRPEIFDLKIKQQKQIYKHVIEIDERIRIVKDKNELKKGSYLDVIETIDGSTGDIVQVLKKPNLEQLKKDLKPLLDEGIKSVAVTLMHSYAYDEHEKSIGDCCKSMGFDHVSLSSETVGTVKIVERGQTNAVDAYLTPLIRDYINQFKSEFEDLNNVELSFMMSDGGLCPVDKFNGYRSILSGPAGGVVGYAKTAYVAIDHEINHDYEEHEAKPKKREHMAVLGFDMGGTSTDVSRFNGDYHHVFETTTAGVSIVAPQLEIRTVAAGGGSRLAFRAGLFIVGPESAGANPGPTCYGREGPLAVTDVNLLLGRIQAKHFPNVFGKDGKQSLNIELTKEKFEKEILTKINQHQKENGRKEMSLEEAAMGFVRIANEAMCRPIRALLQCHGLSAKRHCLAAFGSAGPQHACSIAKALGVQKVFIHRHSGILSAFGIALADNVYESQKSISMKFDEKNSKEFDKQFELLAKPLLNDLKKRGFDEKEIEVFKYLELRYNGTDTSIMVPKEKENNDYEKSFIEIHKNEYGFVLQNRFLEIKSYRVRVVAHSLVDKHPPLNQIEKGTKPKQIDEVDCFFEDKWIKTPVFNLSELSIDTKLEGPCVILLPTSSILVEPECIAHVSEDGDIIIDVPSGIAGNINEKVDLIQLSVFAHRFMSIAEQMGYTLRRTAISVNIKERLDFSCALFGPDGSLVANAPHLPVHLGAMQEAVKWQINHIKGEWKDGDVVMSNHPAAGGSHLPDITVITPVFDNDKIVFFVASRGHHADVGGISPGSMPPHSTSLAQEGVCFKSTLIVRDGVFDDETVEKVLTTPPSNNVVGTRCLRDNISDLKAQVAANKRGIALVSDLIEEFSLEVVQAYMDHVQTAASDAVRAMLRKISDKHVSEHPEKQNSNIISVESNDFMDCGAEIKLLLIINREQGSAVFDFTGTSKQVITNINSPRAVTYSAVIYSLRCLVSEDIPLNSGCLQPIEIIIPRGSILWPSDDAAVVGGNVLTSQRVTDVVLSAFGAVANSLGCMNNFTFGTENSGYYETIGGGAGAGPDWHGASGVQTHMTNTRITDAEVLERRFAVLLREFSIRNHSGGNGLFKGGDGLIRIVEFLSEMDVAILSERRSLPPNGFNGGENGLRGKNFLHKKSNNSTINITGNMAIKVVAGDKIEIQTPGGGGFGKKK